MRHHRCFQPKFIWRAFPILYKARLVNDIARLWLSNSICWTIQVQFGGLFRFLPLFAWISLLVNWSIQNDYRRLMRPYPSRLYRMPPLEWEPDFGPCIQDQNRQRTGRPPLVLACVMLAPRTCLPNRTTFWLPIARHPWVQSTASRHWTNSLVFPLL